jgi:hypothetical protein
MDSPFEREEAMPRSLEEERLLRRSSSEKSEESE